MLKQVCMEAMCGHTLNKLHQKELVHKMRENGGNRTLDLSPWFMLSSI